MWPRDGKLTFVIQVRNKAGNQSHQPSNNTVAATLDIERVYTIRTAFRFLAWLRRVC